ncbi:MAG: mechanosensitive ion channel family protein [Actinomycetes bacterium]
MPAVDLLSIANLTTLAATVLPGAVSATPAPGSGTGGTATPTPAPTETASRVDEALDPTQTHCGTQDPTVCGWLHNVSGNETFARWAVGIGDTALRIVLIVVLGLLVRSLLHRTIGRLSERIALGRTGVGRWGSRAAVLEGGPLSGERREQRARTIGSVLKSLTTAVVALVVVLLVLGEFGVNLAPLLAGAGVLGVALGFGSQTLVKDFLSGVFMIVEDQYGVGDVVDLGEASGSVEAVGLRVTRIRDVNGTVWYVRNGEILRVGNQSQGWARAVLDVQVAYGEDIGNVQDLLKEVAHELSLEPDWAHLILEEPEVWGVEALTADWVVLRLVVKTVPLEQWKVGRELRRRIKSRFDAEGVEIPFPQRTVWLRSEDERPASQKERSEPVVRDHDRHDPPPKGESDVMAETDTKSASGL